MNTNDVMWSLTEAAMDRNIFRSDEETEYWSPAPNVMKCDAGDWRAEWVRVDGKWHLTRWWSERDEEGFEEEQEDEEQWTNPPLLRGTRGYQRPRVNGGMFPWQYYRWVVIRHSDGTLEAHRHWYNNAMR